MITFLGVIIFVGIILFASKKIATTKSPKTLPWNDGTGVGGGGDSDDNPNRI